LDGKLSGSPYVPLWHTDGFDAPNNATNFHVIGTILDNILSDFIKHGVLTVHNNFSRGAIIFFSGAIILNEIILLANWIGLLLYITDPIYPWL